MSSFSVKSPSDSHLAHSRSLTTRYEICATSDQSKVLLEITQDINEQICIVRKLRQQRSGNLSISEKSWIDNATDDTTTTISGIANFIEPMPETASPERRRLPGSSFLQQLRYLIKDSPQLPAQVARLSVAAQSLNTAISIMSDCADGSSQSQVESTDTQKNTLDASWNELSELIHRRRCNSENFTTSHMQIPPALGSQSRSSSSPNSVRSSQQSPTWEAYSGTSATACAKLDGSETCHTHAFSIDAEEFLATSSHGIPLNQKRTTLPIAMTDHQNVDPRLTLIIETVDDWRQTTERALNDINALSLALTSGIVDPSISRTFTRSRLQNISHDQFPRRKPVPGPPFPISHLSLPPEPTIAFSLRNSFDKESLPQRNIQHNNNNTIQRSDKTQDSSIHSDASPQTPSWDKTSCSSENASTTSSPSPIPPQSFRISRGRAWLERRAESSQEAELDRFCMPER
jgi:hypothetical protein